MDIIKVCLTSVGSILALFVLTKLMGNRQVSQLSLFDYINGITIGSIAAEMATSLENDFWLPLIAMTIYALAAIFASFLSCKSRAMRKILEGSPKILYDNGKLFESNFKKARLDLNEFLMQCRTNGYFDLSQLQTAMLESNGRISFLPLSGFRPVTPTDMNLGVQGEKFMLDLIIDGKIMQDNLKNSGNDRKWLYDRLAEQGNPKVSDIFLATCDFNNALKIYYKGQK